jgi:hypothetical protein
VKCRLFPEKMNFRFVMKSLLTLLLFVAAGLQAQETSTPAPGKAPQAAAKPEPETPAAESSVDAEAPPVATPGARPVAATKPVNMFEQDFDEAAGIFMVPGTKVPYSGPVFATNDDGGKTAEGALKDGKEEGYWVEWYDNGIKSMEGTYRGGLEVGNWKYWHETGKLKSEGAYSNGVAIGRWKTFFEDGTPETEGVYINGKMDGDWKVYTQETGTFQIVKYKDDEEIIR